MPCAVLSLPTRGVFFLQLIPGCSITGGCLGHFPMAAGMLCGLPSWQLFSLLSLFSALFWTSGCTHCSLPFSLSIPKLWYFLSSQLLIMEVRGGPVQKKRGIDVDHHLLCLHSLQFSYFHSLKTPCSLFSLS